MGKFLRLLEEHDPNLAAQAASAGKYAVKDALEAKGITVSTVPNQPTLKFTFNDIEYSVSVTPNAAIGAPEEEQESVSPEDQRIQDEISNLKMADAAVGKDPNLERSKRDLTTKVGSAFQKIGNKLSTF